MACSQLFMYDECTFNVWTLPSAFSAISPTIGISVAKYRNDRRSITFTAVNSAYNLTADWADAYCIRHSWFNKTNSTGSFNSWYMMIKNATNGPVNYENIEMIKAQIPWKCRGIFLFSKHIPTHKLYKCNTAFQTQRLTKQMFSIVLSSLLNSKVVIIIQEKTFFRCLSDSLFLLGIRTRLPRLKSLTTGTGWQNSFPVMDYFYEKLNTRILELQNTFCYSLQQKSNLNTLTEQQFTPNTEN